MNTGQKTKNGMLGVKPDGAKLQTFAQIVDGMGKSTGVVTTVPFCHATPAGVWSHNQSRNKYTEIASEMILDSGLDVIFGAGYPDYDDDGQQLQEPKDKYIDLPLLESIRKGEKEPWTFIEDKADFEQTGANLQSPTETLSGHRPRRQHPFSKSAPVTLPTVKYPTCQ